MTDELKILVRTKTEGFKYISKSYALSYFETRPSCGWSLKHATSLKYWERQQETFNNEWKYEIMTQQPHRHLKSTIIKNKAIIKCYHRLQEVFSETFMALPHDSAYRYYVIKTN